ncbi:MAG: hypothetical protein HN919_21995 [Verrucomicrobia bacterium]|nr:hypothetical protein [Verrucomicrobiota bacterium]
MSPGTLNAELQGVSRKVRGWRAQFRLVLAAAAVILFVWLFSLVDLWVHCGRVERSVIWAGLVGLMAIGAWSVQHARHRALNVLAVAAMLERSFPELDNHLINYLQFAADPGDDPFKQAYLKQGAPAWRGLDITALKNRKRHQRARYALIAAAVLLVTPGAFLGKAWGMAVWRVVNPFSNAAPVTLTTIESVDPGDAIVRQGAPLVLRCTVRGYEGHKVSLDVHPADQARTTYALGRITGSVPQTFSYRLPAVNTALRYRFRAGDSPFPRWYSVQTRPPLGFVKLQATLTPPAYTGQSAQEVDLLADALTVPAGSHLALAVIANLPVTRLGVRQGTTEVEMATTGDRTVWEGALSLTNGMPLTLVAVGAQGDRLEQSVPFVLEPDRLPVITVIAPEGRPVLARGDSPSITFSVADDYGLAAVSVEQVKAGSSRKAVGTVLGTWMPFGKVEWMQSWGDAQWHSREEHTLAYRIVARDNGPGAEARRTVRSSLIVFNAPSMADAAAKRNELEAEAFSSLAKIIQMQRDNLVQSRAQQGAVAEATAVQWQAVAAVQGEIRRGMHALLQNPLEPLGNLTSVAKKLYLNEMAEVIPLLAGIAGTARDDRPGRAARAVTMEEKILRQLTFADVSAAKAKVQRRISALTGMLARLVKEQAAIIKQTQTYIKQAAHVGETLIDGQDELALDLTDFVDACRKESVEVEVNDDNYARLLMGLAERCHEEKIRDDMMLASEQLEADQPEAAVPHESESLRKLKELQVLLDEVLAEDQLEEQEAMLEMILEAKKRVERLKDVHAKALESMERVKDQLDKDNKDVDLMEEEYQELLANTKEALLQVPTDLNIFMELNVANDIIEDVFSVFEEVEQAEGSEALDKDDVEERALAKREEYLEGMEEAKDRLDALEQWLADKPDSMKITAEAFDQEELPEAGISLGALTTEAEDLIGDLLEKDEEMSEEADDGAINTSVPDMMANNEVKEGDVASFAAQGKSGNETPDHKEQDGRSNVGRQGMAVGETAAGSGTINEGDKDIEERRTQDPTQSGQVDLDGEDVQTKATGGGKLGTGKADAQGMGGGVKRMDSTEEGSMEGLDALMAKQVDSMFAKASMQNVRADGLKDAAPHLRQASDAVAKGNIAQMKEHRRLAVAAMRKAKARMDAAQSGSFSIQENPSLLDDVVEGGAEQAPAEYREMVADYYKILNSSL